MISGRNFDCYFCFLNTFRKWNPKIADVTEWDKRLGLLNNVQKSSFQY